MSNPFAVLGSTSIQKQALRTHNGSETHKLAVQRKKFTMGEVKHIEDHVELMVDSEKNRIIGVIQIVYRIAMKDMSLESLEDECKYHIFRRTPNMPKSSEYSSNMNPMAGKEFLAALYLVYFERLKEEICCNPFYSILVDESTDRRFEKHLIVYIKYLKDGGTGPRVTSFVKLIGIDDGKAETMHLAIKQLLEEMSLPFSKLITMGSDGAAAMVGANASLIAKLRHDVPHLVGVHCVAHREALAIKDACECFAEIKLVDKFAQKVREWVGNSSLQRKEVQKLSYVFLDKPYEILKHTPIRWLSQGKVMKRLAKVIPVLLECWKNDFRSLYKISINFELLFLIFFLGDVLEEVDVLNLKFQSNEVDITIIGREIDVLVKLLKDMYINNVFGCGSRRLTDFLNAIKDGVFTYKDKQDILHQHKLSFVSMLDNKKKIQVADCFSLCQAFCRRLIHNIESRFPDRHLFNAAKLFSLKNYPIDFAIRGQIARQYLNQLCDKFNQGDCSLVQIRQREGELQRFILTLFEAYPSLGLLEAWNHCGGDREWKQRYPALHTLWQMVIVLPSSSTACERGFSKQNHIKTNERSNISLDTIFNKFMFMSLSAPKDVYSVDWDSIFEAWKSTKNRRPQALVGN